MRHLHHYRNVARSAATPQSSTLPRENASTPNHLLIKTLFSSLILLGAQQANAQLTSSPTATFPAPTQTNRVIVADFDGDGDADILYQTGGAGTAYQYAESNGNGTYTLLALSASRFNGMTFPDHSGVNFRPADYDGDGDIDIWAVANSSTGTYFQNNGTSFSSPSTTGVFPAPTAGVRTTAADFDGDGDADILYQTGTASSPYGYYRSNGNGTFTNVPIGSSPFAGLIIPDHNGSNFKVADFDGDGDVDLYVGVNGSAGAYFRNDAGTFTAQAGTVATLPTIAAGSRTAVGDFDGDGDADILAQSGANGTAFVYYQSNGNGTFSNVALASSPFGGLGTLPDNSGSNYQVGDLDGDGDFDVWLGAANTFYRQVSNLPPKISSTVPANSAVGVATNANIVLNFNENINTVGAGNILIRRYSDDVILETIAANNGTKVTGVGTSTITINPTANLATSTKYYVQIMPKSFYDADGMTYGIASANTNTVGPLLDKDLFAFTTSVVALPVELSGIAAERITVNGTQQVKLSWQTASEQDVKGFWIQRSGDAKIASDMAFVAAKSNGAPHSGGYTYEWIDEQPINGMNYYQLRIVDIDGSYNYSKTVPVSVREAGGGITLYPNPSTGMITINGDAAALQDASLMVSDLTGKLMLYSKVPASGVVNLASLAAGSYIVEVKNDAAGLQFRTTVTLNK
jgi:hypothetical protein